MGPLGSFRDHRNWMRFSYHRSFRRATRPQVERSLRNLLSRRSQPSRLASIGLTHRCQNHCEWCATGTYRQEAYGEMTTGQVERLLREISESRYLFSYVSFMGGECLLRPDLDHLIRVAADLGLFVHMSTNGLKLDAARVRALLHAGLNSVFIAFRPTPPRDERETRKQQLVLRAVAECVRHDLPCFLSVCVCKEDVFSGRVERTIALGRQLGVAGVRLLPVRLSGRWLRQDPGCVLDKAEQSHLRALCRSGFAFLTDDADRQEGRICAAVARRILYVSPYGEAQPCHFFPFSFGNVTTEGFDQVLSRMWSHRLLPTESQECPLHDPLYRAQHITSIPDNAQLPLQV